SVRVALGASWLRLVRQLFTESSALALLGGLAGIVLARVFLNLILHYAPPSLLDGSKVSIDGRALLFTCGVVMLSAVLAGIAPVWRILASNLNARMRQGRNSTGAKGLLRAGLA